MGANIRGAGTDVIKIRGVKSLHKAEYSIIPDQIEAGTFMFAAAATRGDVTVLNVIPKHLDATISKLIDIGCEVEEFDDAVRVVAKGRLKSTQVKTLPYPGYPTDMQPQIGVVLALASGTSTITESIFLNRFKYLDELARMGANIKVGKVILLRSRAWRTTFHLDIRSHTCKLIKILKAILKNTVCDRTCSTCKSEYYSRSLPAAYIYRIPGYGSVFTCVLLQSCFAHYTEYIVKLFHFTADYGSSFEMGRIEMLADRVRTVHISTGRCCSKP